MYLVLDRAGNVLYEAESSYEANWFLGREGKTAQWLAPPDAAPSWAEQVSANPVEDQPMQALRLAGLPIIRDRSEIDRISLKDAYYTCLPYFWEARMAAEAHGVHRGMTKLSEMLRAAHGLLSENTKLHKRDPLTPKAVAVGLSLLPEHSIFRGETEGGVNLQPLSPVEASPRATLCMHSSPECRASCLVYSGQNQAHWVGNFAKGAKAKALVEAPHHFMRLLLEAIEHYVRDKSVKLGRGKAMKFLRLNVFSDIPWEIMAPWLFEDTRVHPYDYSKVPGRAFIPNYDLSYSYSGRNLPYCDQELRRGRRVVVVFSAPQFVTPQVAQRRVKNKKAKKFAYVQANPLPEWISDPGLVDGQRIRVTDGDRSDIRPFDPTDVVVGLRWKSPLWKTPVPDRFVVKGEVVESSLGRIYKLPETPLSRPGRKLAVLS